jgi:hypothetical protein
MTEKEDLREAFVMGFVSARKGGFTSNELGPLTQKTAEDLFQQWWDRQ